MFKFLKKIPKESILLAFIILIAIFFRFYHFPYNPPSLNWDEVSIGYNAHSILLTGKDEFGNKLPLYFRSLDDYKQPVHIYLVAASEVVFGYNDFAVRFPSALFGVLSVLLIYLLAFELTRKKSVALISSLIYAVIPWAVSFSRYSLEANTALFFLLLGIVLFLKSFKSKLPLLPLSMIVFGIASYTYLSYKVIVPLTIIGLILIFRKKLELKNKMVRLSLILFILVIFLIARDSLNPLGQVRFNGTSVLNDTKTFQHEFLEMQYEGTLKINLPRRFFHEIPILTNGGLIARGYFTHFSPNFLFFDTGIKYHFAPNIGLLYLWMVPFILFGAYKLFGEKGDHKFVLLLLVIIAPIPASVTYDIPHAIRVFLLSVPLTIFTGIGVHALYLWLMTQDKILGKIFILFMGLIIFLFSWQFFRQYQINLPHERSSQWIYGREEMTKYLFENENKYKRIIVSTHLEWPNVFMLYYSKYDPAKYLDGGGTKSGSWAEEGNHFDNFYFHKFSYPKDVLTDDTLLVGKPEEFPPKVKPIKVIYYLDGTPAIYFVKSADIRPLVPQN